MYTLDDHLGYKKGHSINMCVWSLNNITEYYSSMGSPVYFCFLDVNKALNRVNNRKLFNKLVAIGTLAHYWIFKVLIHSSGILW